MTTADLFKLADAHRARLALVRRRDGTYGVWTDKLAMEFVIQRAQRVAPLDITEIHEELQRRAGAHRRPATVDALDSAEAAR